MSRADRIVVRKLFPLEKYPGMLSLLAGGYSSIFPTRRSLVFFVLLGEKLND